MRPGIHSWVLRQGQGDTKVLDRKEALSRYKGKGEMEGNVCSSAHKDKRAETVVRKWDQ